MTSLSLFTFTHWRRKWQPTPVFLPGESQGWGSLVGYRLWSRTESDTTEATQQQQQQQQCTIGPCWLPILCFSSVQFSSVAQSCPTLCNPMNCSTPGLPIHNQLLEFTQLTSIKLVMPSSHLILRRPLLPLPPISPSIRVFPISQLFA